MMSEQMQDIQNPNRPEGPSPQILLRNEIHIPGMNQYIVTMEQIKGCRVFVITKPSKYYCKRQIIVPVKFYKDLLDRIEHILSINLSTKYINKVSLFGLVKTLRTDMEDYRSYYYNISSQNGIYYATIIQVKNCNLTIFTLDFLSLKSIGVVIKTILEDSNQSFWSNLETVEYSCPDLLAGEDDSDSSTYRDRSESKLKFLYSD
ncbi:hypothetical protein RF11_10908 [Thelohanellus kitauei]|uniref:Uncharacterized protein n=1 Tax=Thelohanellus kitauei TaxID=669202 RepID=A0A0C2NCX5_THEKT|nr:hypothetical protein RF11_10908 [Thelohanellus kitauei]